MREGEARPSEGRCSAAECWRSVKRLDEWNERRAIPIGGHPVKSRGRLRERNEDVDGQGEGKGQRRLNELCWGSLLALRAVPLSLFVTALLDDAGTSYSDRKVSLVLMK